MFPPMAASAHGLRMGSTRIIWVRTQWSVLQVCLNLASAVTASPNTPSTKASTWLRDMTELSQSSALMDTSSRSSMLSKL